MNVGISIWILFVIILAATDKINGDISVQISFISISKYEMKIIKEKENKTYKNLLNSVALVTPIMLQSFIRSQHEKYIQENEKLTYPWP